MDKGFPFHICYWYIDINFLVLVQIVIIMRKIILEKAIGVKRLMAACIAITVLMLNGSAQPAVAWSKQFGTDKEEYVRNHVTDKDGNIYVSGYTYGDMDGKNAGQKDGFIAKFDNLGNVKWTRQYGTSGDDEMQWSAISPNNNIYIVGLTNGDLAGKSHGKEDIYIVKYNTAGQKLWTRQFGSDSMDIAYGVYVDNKENVFVCGATMGVLGKTSSGLQDAFLMKLDSSGQVQYINQFGTGIHDACVAVIGDGKGNIYVVGSTFGVLADSSKGMMDVFTGKFNEKGEAVKYNQYGSAGFDVPTSIAVDKTGNLYLGGTTSDNFGGTQLGEGDCFFMKINTKGEVEWNQQFGTQKHDGVKCIAINEKASDNILVSGLANLPPANAYIRMYKKDGSLVWEKKFGSEADGIDASGKDVSIDDKGNIVHIGLTSSNLFGTQSGVSDMYIVKMK
jgi:hypothetical protein